MKCLIVDDQEENRYLLQSLLEGAGYDVAQAKNGKEGMEVLGDEPVDAVISDILMPVMDGYQFCREVRSTPATACLPFIFYTATYVDQKDEEFAYKLGADAFIRKPIDPRKFLGTIEKILKKKKKSTPEPPLETKPEEEKEILKLYNERLVTKLEKKMMDLEQEIHKRQEADRARVHTEEKFRTLIEQASDAIYLLSGDGIILDVNPSACSILGYSEEELTGMNFRDLVPPEDLQVVPWKLPELQEGKSLVFERKMTRKDGSIVLVEISAKALHDGRIQGIARDITRRKKAEAALKESEERYALAARGANDGLWDWNMKSEEMYFSPRWKSMLGYEEDQIGNAPDEWFDRVHPDDIDELKLELESHLKGVTPHFEHEHRILHGNSTYRWMLTRGLAVRDASGEPVRMSGSQTDITERKRAEERLLHDAFHDSLTGLPNRALFVDRLEQACRRVKRYKEYQFAVLHMDVDQFKNINESLGHEIGDRLLITMAEKIQSLIRPVDTLARFSADEFVLLLDSIEDIGDVTGTIEKIQGELSRPIPLKDQEVFASVSIGIAMSSPGYERSETYLRDAHSAMHKAKSQGRGRYATFDPETHRKATARLKLENDLRRAVERGEFEVYYQPIVDLAIDRTTSLEALIRWRHPQRGILLPRDFIGIAEDSGLIVPMDRFVFRKACADLKEWKAAFADLDLRISVNLSSVQIAREDFVRFVSDMLDESDIDPDRLCFELTESMIIENVNQARSTLFQLQELGVHLHIDDFGTGYSSLSYLNHFPIDLLKIDRSFIGQMMTNRDQAKIVQSIISLAHSLDMHALAEGVENENLLPQLKELKCNYAQGFYFSKPVDSKQVTGFLHPNNRGHNNRGQA